MCQKQVLFPPSLRVLAVANLTDSLRGSVYSTRKMIKVNHVSCTPSLDDPKSGFNHTFLLLLQLSRNSV